MNPHHLRTFLSVRKHRNYTRAAEEVFLTKPAVSRQMRQLEEELGVRPFGQIGQPLPRTGERSPRVESMLVRNELDLGFVGANLSSRELELKPLVEDEIVCFTSPSHRLAKVRRIAPSSLEEEMWIIREKGSATRLLFEDWLLSRKGAIRQSIDLTCPETCKALVRAGIGISFMSVHGLRAEIRAKNLVKILVTEMSLKRPIYLPNHSDKRNSPVMESFLAIVEIALPKLTTPRGYGGR